MNAAIITARKGPKDKNMWAVAGKPIVYYPMMAATLSSHVHETYVTTDSREVKMVALSMGIKIIDRPEELSGDNVNHGEVIKHAVEQVPDEFENIVVLLGNTIMTDEHLINQALIMLNDQSEIDSVMSVIDLSDNHPVRTMKLDENDHLQSFFSYEENINPSTNRQDYEPAYLYDGGVWAFRRACIHSSGNIGPWWWMGDKCAPIIRPWTPVRDVHDNVEIAVSEWWLEQGNAKD